MGWLILAVLALIAFTWASKQFSYWWWVRSIKDPQKRMDAELLYRAWRKRKRKL